MSLRRKFADLLQYFNPFAANPPQDEDVPARKRPRLEVSVSVSNAEDAGDTDTFVDAQTTHTVATASPDDTVAVAPKDAVAVVATSLPRASLVYLPYHKWTAEEDAKLTKAVTELGKCWLLVAGRIPGRKNEQCRKRWKTSLDPTIDRKTLHVADTYADTTDWPDDTVAVVPTDAVARTSAIIMEGATDKASVPTENKRKVGRMSGTMRRKAGKRTFPWETAVAANITPLPQDEDITHEFNRSDHHVGPRTPKIHCELSLTDEQRHSLHLKRRKKKRSREKARLENQKKVASPVEYICALCRECYSSKCYANPWWALAEQECPKCCKMQIPRIDIGARANAIEYHPALLAHASHAKCITGGASSQMKIPSFISTTPAPGTTVKDDGDLDSLRSALSDDDSLHSAEFDSETAASMLASEQAENENFGGEYEGPTLPHIQASRLLILMAHASTCPGRHKSAKHGDACRNTKWMMLHVRDCPGTTSSYDVCPFPWCRKVKHLLFHLVSCTRPQSCEICAPAEIDSNWHALKNLNDHRLKKFRERLTAQWKDRAATGTFRSKSLVSGSETPVSSIDVQDHAVCNTMPPARSPFDEPLCDSLEVKSRTTDTEDVDSTTPSFVGKSRHSPPPLFESSLFVSDQDVVKVKVEESVVAVNGRQESHTDTEDVDSTTPSLVGKIRHSPPPLFESSLFGSDQDVVKVKVEESVVAVNRKQESHNSTMTPGEVEELERDAAACFDRGSIIDASLCQKEIDENQRDWLDEGSSEASYGKYIV